MLILESNVFVVVHQMPPGADTASSWPRSGRNWVRSTRTVLTSSSRRWTPQPTRLKRSKSIASPPWSSSLQETSARWACPFAPSTRSKGTNWWVRFVYHADSNAVQTGSVLLPAHIYVLRRLCVHNLSPPRLPSVIGTSGFSDLNDEQKPDLASALHRGSGCLL